MLGSIRMLDEIARRCRAGETLDPRLAQWLGTALEGYLTRKHRTVGEAFGLIFPKGGVPWWREIAIRRRDAALRTLAEIVAPDGSTRARAQRVCELSLRYGASAWRHDRDRPDMPMHYRNTAKAHLWDAFASGAAMPLGERQLRNILAG